MADNDLKPTNHGSDSKMKKRKSNRAVEGAVAGDAKTSDHLAHLLSASVNQSDVLVNIRDSPLSKATVYSDRVELTREVTVSLENAGLTVVKMRGISSRLDAHSVRVKGVGHGAIVDVAEETLGRNEWDEDEDEEESADEEEDADANDDDSRTVAEVVDADEGVSKLAKAAQEVKHRWQVNRKASERLNSERKVLKQFVDAAAGSGGGKKAEAQPLLTQTDSLASFLSFYGVQLEQLSERETALGLEHEALDSELDAANREYERVKAKATRAEERRRRAAQKEKAKRRAAKAKAKAKAKSQVKKVVDAEHNACVAITVAVEQPGDVHLSVTYVLRGASWTPSYDARVDSASATLQLVYFATLVNTSGEDWVSKLQLSTATPSANSGQPPKLETAYVDFKKAAVMHMRSQVSPASNMMYMSSDLDESSVNPLMSQSFMPMGRGMGGGGGGGPPLPPPPMAAVGSSVVDQAGDASSATFSIDRVCTVESDAREHRFTVAILPLEVAFANVCVPVKLAKAYLRALTHNTTPYTLLPGAMRVYIDGGYVAEAELRRTNPGDELQLFLGEDEKVQVELRAGNEKKSQVGTIFKSNAKEYRYEVTVKNSKKATANLAMFFQLPQAKDGRIKVRLVKPSSYERDNEDAEVLLNSFHNIRWNVKVKAGQEKQFIYHYVVEFPKDESIELTG